MSEFVFYIFDEDAVQYSFWLLTEEDIGLALYTRSPDSGVWNNPQPKSDYEPVEPTIEFKKIIARFQDDGVELQELEDLPKHEQHFFSVIEGTTDENPEAIPAPVWNWMAECFETFRAGDAET